jgi:hypothetical protein
MGGQMKANTEPKAEIDEAGRSNKSRLRKKEMVRGHAEPAWVIAFRVCFQHYVAAHPERFRVDDQRGSRRRIRIFSINEM